MSDYRLKVIRKNIRHAYIRVSSEGVVTVTVNRKKDDEFVNALLREKDAWIRKRLREAENTCEPDNLDGLRLAVLGKSHVIRVVRSNVENVWAEEGTLYVMTENDSVFHQAELIEEYLKGVFDSYVEKALPELRKRADRFFRTDDVRTRTRLLKSRYGSYSRKTGTIALNLFLVSFAPEVIDSVIFHELAHQKHMNHQKGFYDLLYRMCPDYDSLQRILKSRKMNHNKTWFLE